MKIATILSLFMIATTFAMPMRHEMQAPRRPAEGRPEGRPRSRMMPPMQDHMGHMQEQMEGARGSMMERVRSGREARISDDTTQSKFTKVRFIQNNDEVTGIDTSGLGGVPTITFCNTTSTPLVINSYTISPDDIEPDEDVTITLKTTLVGETVTSGTIHVDAKVGKFPIVDQDYDLCTEIQQAGLSCPLSPGPYDISQTIDIPSIPISGTVDATATIYDQSSNELACVEVTVSV